MVADSSQWDGTCHCAEEKSAAGTVTGDAMIGIQHRHGVTGTLMLRACNAAHHREKP
jgi:hypothetical protein